MADFTRVEFDHEGAALVGLMARPPGQGPFPTVLVMHNALGVGRHVREVAQRLAALGYLAVATDMYGGGAENLDQTAAGAAYALFLEKPALLRERVAAWYERVAALPEVTTDRVAAIGYCFGGTCVLELARSGASARAVVSYHGILTTAQPMQPGAFAGEVAAFCGGLDPYAPLEQIEGLRIELAAAGAKHSVTTFGEAAHGFTDPYIDETRREGIAYHAIADKLSWAGTVALLEAVLNT